MAIYRGPGGAGDATGDATNASALALAAKDEAIASATSAASSATAAGNSATAADASATSAATQATNAAGSATSAATSATNASNSATAASSSATTAASEASDAADSATAAASSATSASTDASTASTQATNAASSASSASTSASTATTKASEASTSATNAASSATTASTAATNASNSASAAATSETNAASSASSAFTSASNASTSASTATTQATNAASSASAAATSETNAASSASAASTSASNASTSATNAASSASSAASSAASAAAALDSFDDRYLGSKTSDPTLDNDGNALVTGALYYNSTDGEMRVYDGSQWIAASAASQAILTKYKYVATAGQTTFSGSDANSLTLAYTVGSIIVTLNGVVMDAADYTATTGTSVVLGAAASLNDELCVISFATFDVADTYTQSQVDAFAVKLTGDQNIAGAKKFTGSVIVGRVNSGSEGGQIDFCRSSDDASAWAVDVYGGTSTPSLRFVDNVASATRMTIDGAGNVGIGTSSPMRKLHLSGSSSCEQAISQSDAKTDGKNWNFLVDGGNGSTNANFTLRLLNDAGNAAPLTGFKIDGTTGQRFTPIGFSATTYAAFDCRAWVNFNGTGTVAIRASGNVSSITDNGTGTYTVNFTTAMPDTNYASFASALSTSGRTGSGYPVGAFNTDTANAVKSTSANRIIFVQNNDLAIVDVDQANYAVFR